MRLLKWFYPGMKVKRWLLLGFLGVMVISVGFAITVSAENKFAKSNGGLVVFAGIALTVIATQRLVKSFVTIFLPQHEKDLVDIFYQKRYLEKGPKIVVMGGGTGLSVLLHGLKEFTSNITAVVTVTDEGGSSGRLRDQYDMPPPGDIRNCLVALADSEPLMGKLFQYRFEKNGTELSGHNFGNLFITAMTKVVGDFEKAIKESSKILAIRGRVIPSTVSSVRLVAKHKDGTQTIGEAEISKGKSPIETISLDSPACEGTQEAVDAIRDAELIILGPGSLYTSVIPNLIVGSITEAILDSKAVKIYICNVMTQPGETDGYKSSDHLKALVQHTSPKIIDFCIVNNGKVPTEFLERYRQENAYPVMPDSFRIRQMGYQVIEDDVISTVDYVRHNPDRLAKILISLFLNAKRRAKK